ncbi:MULTISPECIES: Tol-Pal system beta propeller repeat protein TolB [Thiorhodovibrio]|uniref:Tol-Pal system beta propeller repeat protein TolB n=1 Tax=Thiorhodovibrio TaxID=61593 RepID=UPI0019147A77|nr:MULTISPECIES: Tol-Pal system beta propeller repeat protein TolB [Thiorhodovibrio]MBK5968690.1 Tol-Pal system beta propeller repeat protein TolB [Thiorhodovibrio winogradskyi]WPL10952.1 translocation protein TolB [Thiorhodovibrio litoralis]
MPRIVSLLLLCLLSLPAQARLTIEITGGVEGAQPIAVVPFGQVEGTVPGVDIASVIAADLARTGRFKPMPTREMLMTPHRAEEVDFREWELLATNNLVIGEVSQAASGGYRVDYSLYDVFGGKKLLGSSLQSSEQGLRLTAHRIADAIYEKLTGDRGVFSTRIAYVTSTGRGTSSERVTLRVADADGFNPQTIVDSPDPIMSPAWSPDGRKLAYVSFENRRSSIYVQELASGRRDKIASYPGINGSPAFSPDGSRMAMTLSKDGNPDVYVMNLASRQLTRLTDHYAIDTEPAWSPDGGTIYFTSDRGGQPQIYRVSASGGAAERVSFEGDYNAAAQVAPNGRSLALVTRTGGSFRIAVDQLGGGRRLLSNGPLDESPSFAPNGSMVIYASQNNGRGVLAVAPIAGGSGQRLTQDAGEVREPAWSPFLR